MLVALDENLNRIEARYATKNKSYYCPVCNEKLILRKGNINIHHFAHHGHSACRYGAGESREHMMMKMIMKDIMERDNRCRPSELEWRFISDKEYRIADYYCRVNKHDVAVECVVHNNNFQHFYEKTVFYYENDIYPIWVFPKNRFSERMRINDVMKSLHAMNYGKVWALDIDTQEIYAVHLNSVQKYQDDEWSYHPYNPYLPYVKNPKFLLLPKFKLHSFKQRTSDKYINFNCSFASPYVRKFW